MMTKPAIFFTGIVVIASLMTTLVIRERAEIKLRENEILLQKKNDQIAKLVSERSRLSKTQGPPNQPANDPMAELVKLRRESETLRKQVLEAGNHSVEPVRPPAWQSISNRTAYLAAHNRFGYESFLAAGKIADAKALSRALRGYAAHQGEFPSHLDQVGPYLEEDHIKLTGTNDFELVYQGSLSELTEVPLREVAVIR